MVRYRTPRKKKATNWASHLATGAMGLVCLAAGLFLMMTSPEPVPAAAPAPVGGEQGATGDAVEAAAPAAPDDPDTDSTGEETPDPLAPPGGGAAGGQVLGLSLILLGILLPVSSVVIERTSGKKWRRRAGKKHPFKRKI